MVPGWNAHVKVENATTVGLGWAVTDSVTGKPQDYDAQIKVWLPQRAGDASVVAKKEWEHVVVNRDASLTCGPNGIEAIVTYNVSATALGNGTHVEVKVCKNAGLKPPPAGDILGGANGQLGEDITVRVLIPGTCA